MNTSPQKVLVVSEEAEQRFALRRTLDALGFDPGEASNSANSLMRLRMVDFDAALIHLSGPWVDGMDLCRQLHQSHPRLPLLILSDFISLEHKVDSLESGADDYMIRPLPDSELKARLRAAIRRSRAPVIPASSRLAIGEIVLDPRRRRVEKSNAEIPLTPLEFRALHILMEQAGKPIPHGELLAMLWGPERRAYRERLRVLIGALRKKLEVDPAHPVYLLTHHQFGYVFAA